VGGVISMLLFIVLAIASVIISLTLGLAAIIKNKERSIIVYSCVLIGILSIYLAFSEFIREIINTY
jgi:hypothetical protein